MEMYAQDMFQSRDVQVVSMLKKGHSVSSIAMYFGVKSDYVMSIADRESKK